MPYRSRSSVRQNAAVNIVFVQGFTQTGGAWAHVLDDFPDTDTPVLFAGELPLRDTFEATALAIGDEGGAGFYVGYSMGGRLALRLALDRPDLVGGLVLISASPGLRDADERAARVEADEARARDIEQHGVDTFLEQWLAQPLFASVPDRRHEIDERRALPEAYLTASLRVLGTGAMEPLWTRLYELQMPVLLVTGTADEKFGAIAREMSESMAHANHVQLAGGHAVPLEQPAELREVIATFVRRHR
jgi:2-succinyl-6-hydroxy-2,4-cyclohexadiene-1-carboxylate synthase